MSDIEQVKLDIDDLTDQDFKELYVTALILLSGDTEEGLLIAHTECLSMREQMDVMYDAEVLPQRSLH